MEIILIVLTSTILTGIIVALGTMMFFVGYHKGQKENKEDIVELNEGNAEAIKQISAWLGYKGK